MITKIEGQLEIHHERGVIYFHSNQTGTTVFRICGLPAIPVVKNRQLDVHHMFGCDWGEITDAERNDNGRTGYAMEKRLIARLLTEK